MCCNIPTIDNGQFFWVISLKPQAYLIFVFLLRFAHGWLREPSVEKTLRRVHYLVDLVLKRSIHSHMRSCPRTVSTVSKIGLHTDRVCGRSRTLLMTRNSVFGVNVTTPARSSSVPDRWFTLPLSLWACTTFRPSLCFHQTVLTAQPINWRESKQRGQRN